MCKVTLSVLILAFVQIVLSFDFRNIVFTIISQPDPYHSSVSKKLKEDIENQVMEIENHRPVIHTTQDFSIPGDWTIFPLLRPLVSRYKGSDVRWIVFIEPHTAVRCGRLLESIANADRQQDTMWIGYPLTDEEPRVIHHFHFYENLEEDGGFVYPNFASGFAMRIELMDMLLKQVERGERKRNSDAFSIDPSYELAQLIYGDGDHPGPLLSADLSFCIVSGDQCATYPRQFYSCGSAIPEESIFFAVKTWTGFHASRTAVVKKTWGKRVSHLLFYSDKADPLLPSINVGVPNTKSGHCAKTMAILKDAVRRARNLPGVNWIFLADDDTTLGVQRLCEVLSCFRGGSDVTVVGERYGYGVWNKETGLRGYDHGYDYITGGGGTAFSVAAADALSKCRCTKSNDPDDMTIGACALHRNITLTHSSLFHQARPQDYPREALVDRPVSFHRHSSPDPFRVYTTWFYHDDLALKRRKREEL
ncbi:beta-1,3-glucosyltransferase isoform X2 [Hyposmocoma kahamanoa]|uniref:beta-1,3-glucosyltransferase isoform X2 n=1 Tax=Hyposmocoma kahamanoa TaxID=1477025 RepID=UPI000E6D90F8|nr:beta-1,3-glucosyltransferase isoform X2 [Hyposmocoma kahamanoa]